MATIVTAEANAFLDANFGSGSPATWYLGLVTTLAADDGSGGVEPVGGSYARLAVTNNNTNFPNASNRQKANGVAFTWPTPTGDWGDIIGVQFFTASSGGTPKYKKLLTVPQEVLTGNVFQFLTGQFVLRVP